MYKKDVRLFGKALVEGLSIKFEQELANSTESALCSEEHKAAMLEIIATGKAIEQRMGKKRLIAILVAAALLLLAGCTAYVYRNEIGSFVENIYEEYVNVELPEDDNVLTEIEHAYTLSYIPERYILTDEIVNSVCVKYTYEIELGGGEHYAFLSAATEAYYKFARPNLPSGMNISAASIRIPYYYDVTGDISTTVDLFELTSSWNEDTVTWNTKPSMKSTRFSTASMPNNGATSSNPQYATFVVTDYARSWYGASNNYGFALKRTGGTANSVKLATKESLQNFAHLTITYTGTHMAEGVFAIKAKDYNGYIESYNADALSWVLQDTASHSSPPLTTSNLENLFKISYRPDHDDYVIRSMLDSSLVIYPSIVNNAPIGGHKTESDAQLSTLFTWHFEYTNGYYYITHVLNGTKYYLKSKSTNNNDNLILTTNRNDSGTKWYFHRYTGNVYEDIEMRYFYSSIYVGDSLAYSAYMRSTRIGHNGPVSYSVTNADAGRTPTDKASINSSTGQLQAYKPGTIKLRVTYPGSPWIWNWTVEIEPCFVNELINKGCVTHSDIKSTGDGFYMLTKSFADILNSANITTLKENSSGTVSRNIRDYYDDWYIYAVENSGEYSYGMLKMREPESDGKDGDDAGVTVSFVSFSYSKLLNLLNSNTNANSYNLLANLDQVTGPGSFDYNAVLGNYFAKVESKAAYLIAEQFVQFIAEKTCYNGVINAPSNYLAIIEEINEIAVCVTAGRGIASAGCENGTRGKSRNKGECY